MSDELLDPLETACSVCYADHDEAIHQATLDIHQWFRQKVTHEFPEEEVYFAEAV